VRGVRCTTGPKLWPPSTVKQIVERRQLVLVILNVLLNARLNGTNAKSKVDIR
jgi:hypothetical protein